MFKTAISGACFALLLFMQSSLHGQDVITAVPCDQMGLVVNVGSQPNMVSLYHPGGYLTWPGAYNVMEWEFTDGEGDVLHEETLVDNSFVSFGFDLPLTDTMHVSVVLTNDSAFLDGAPVACLIEDVLFWEINTYPNGVEYGTWTLGGSVGVDANGAVHSGCTYAWACNFDSEAHVDDGSCEIQSCAGCTVPTANNYDPEALIDDGSCEVTVNESSCSVDLDGDGTVATGDLLMFLTAFGEVCY